MEIPDQLRAARRAASFIPGFELLQDFLWSAYANQWILRFSLTLDKEVPGLIPVTTNWYALISDLYPQGTVTIYPDKIGGITATFPHQLFNAEGSVKQPWRDGQICVTVPDHIWGRSALRKEPLDSEERLSWHIERAIHWLNAAASGTLQSPGDPFEWPSFPNYNKQILIFSEDQANYLTWQQSKESNGIALLKRAPWNENILITHQFSNSPTDLNIVWGTYLTSVKTEHSAMWVKLPQIPILNPYQVAVTWDELINVCAGMGNDIKVTIGNLLFKHFNKLPDRLMLGFPVAERFGDPMVQMHWFAIQFPAFPKQAGFINRKNYCQHVVDFIMAKGKKIEWIPTENWHQSQISARGKVDPTLRNNSIAILGAGAVGSLFSDLLARLGCENIEIIDPEIIQIGNLGRHVLTMRSVHYSKAVELTKYLNSIFPYTNANGHGRSAEELLGRNPGVLSSADILVDATGVDETLAMLTKLPPNSKQKLISLSTDLTASKLFCLVSSMKSPQSSIDHFIQVLAPFLSEQEKTVSTDQFPLENLGCWHPLSPARLDDITMLVSAALKPIEKAIAQNQDNYIFVIEKTMNENGDFTGIIIKYP